MSDDNKTLVQPLTMGGVIEWLKQRDDHAWCWLQNRSEMERVLGAARRHCQECGQELHYTTHAPGCEYARSLFAVDPVALAHEVHFAHHLALYENEEFDKRVSHG